MLDFADEFGWHACLAYPVPRRAARSQNVRVLADEATMRFAELRVHELGPAELAVFVLVIVALGPVPLPHELIAGGR